MAHAEAHVPVTVKCGFQQAHVLKLSYRAQGGANVGTLHQLQFAVCPCNLEAMMGLLTSFTFEEADELSKLAWSKRSGAALPIHWVKKRERGGPGLVVAFAGIELRDEGVRFMDADGKV